MTPDSGATSYLSAPDFLLRRDYRSVGQYLADNPADVLTNPAQIEASPILAALLQSASGLLESAALRGGRYSVADLGAMTGNALEYMKQIIADITMFYVCIRRPGPAPADTIVDAYNRALDALGALADGTQIFGFVESAAAGRPLTVPIPPAQYFANNLISARWGRYFGKRQDIRRF